MPAAPKKVKIPRFRLRDDRPDLSSVEVSLKARKPQDFVVSGDAMPATGRASPESCRPSYKRRNITTATKAT